MLWQKPELNFSHLLHHPRGFPLKPTMLLTLRGAYKLFYWPIICEFLYGTIAFNLDCGKKS
ncbi:CLUMA_CG016939, isoform A [Clunio marinus]|uniref:CLUMA_CG016939, isoform A n=1 Tax=Clunio marinus TaxID=568069 RepID=A0A1J1ITA5_9DIPT|nr:CLUMA_CG016939, isoform A [Clunio marinus]